jgi:hypothetical protein
MEVLSDPTPLAPLLEAAVAAGHLRRRGSRPGGWGLAAPPGPVVWLAGDRRCWAIDADGMLPLYRDIYRRIVAERLLAWELAGEAVVLLVAGDLIFYCGPDDWLAPRLPERVARERLAAGDRAWVDRLDGWWRRAASGFDQQAERFWADLVRGDVSAGALRALVDAKVRLNAIGVDSLMPARTDAEAWLTPYLPAARLADVVDGCYLPAAGRVAYDTLEAECWRLADAVQQAGGLTEAARARFVQQGLFFLYAALNNDGKPYFFDEHVRETAQRYSMAAAGPAALAAQLQAVEERDWRRRLHHEWARQQIAAIDDDDARRRLLALHRLLGSARDFDEAKRWLNRSLWRSLLALADGLGVSLGHPRANLDALCAAIDRQGGRVTIDPLFAAPVHEGRPDHEDQRRR